ncbi:phosphohydrolase [Deinococcus aerolatus]|uniref:Phosphohydrolase n=1 Tax=Deinococcus aerolatus TaxID=522487 RepID=A0ABQ2G548_9DEIO|nr:metallophosphoesterase [Deinococcus aerolatus]GGL75879.1 phosphohydrolase [Deinococcus aerolatus]
MRVFAIADLHLAYVTPKPMTVFGPQWAGHPEAIYERWREVVRPGDLVLLPGDLSWAMRLPDAMTDLARVAQLPGTKVLLRGNHDYWWPTPSRLRAALPPGMLAVHNDAVRVEDSGGRGVVVCGTRGWNTPGYVPLNEEDQRLLNREAQRLTLSVEAAARLRQPGDHVLMMLHYPPASAPYPPNPLTTVIEAARPELIAYGHLHGVPVEKSMRHVNGIPAHLVAADGLKFTPKLLLDTGD